MRPTLLLDDAMFGKVKTNARSREVAGDKTVSEAVHRDFQALLRTCVVNGFHVVDLPLDSPVVTSEHVRNLEDEIE